MIAIRSAARLAAAAAVAVLAAACGSASGPGSAGTSTTPAPSASTPPPAATAPVTTVPGGQPSVPRCHTNQLTPLLTARNHGMGGQVGMTLVLTNHSGSTCYLHGYPGLGFYDAGGAAMATHLTWAPASHATVVLHPGDHAVAVLTWRINTDRATPFRPDTVHITPPDEYTYLSLHWWGGAVLNGSIASGPLRAARGPFPATTGTISIPDKDMCVTVFPGSSTVVAWKCGSGTGSQQWTGYPDGTLRNNGKCLEPAGPQADAPVRVAACTGTATQQWAIAQVSGNDFGPLSNRGTGSALGDPANGSTNGSPLRMRPDRGDLTFPWHVSFHDYMFG